MNKELFFKWFTEMLLPNIPDQSLIVMIKIPPKYAVSSVIGYIKGKSAIVVARRFSGRKRNFSGEKFWSRGYAVSTVGFEESQVRKYIRDQEDRDNRNEEGRF